MAQTNHEQELFVDIVFRSSNLSLLSSGNKIRVLIRQNMLYNFICRGE